MTDEERAVFVEARDIIRRRGACAEGFGILSRIDALLAGKPWVDPWSEEGRTARFAAWNAAATAEPGGAA